MSARSRLAVQTIARTLVEWKLMFFGWSWNSSSPRGAAGGWSAWATPPKLTLLPALSIIQPPLVMSPLHELAGSTHVLVAAPHGGAPLGPAQPVIASWPGRI